MKMGVRAASRAGNGPGFQPSRISFRYSWGVAPGWDGLRLWRAGQRTCITPALPKANPIGVAEDPLQPKLPAELNGKLPTAKQLADAVKGEIGRMKDELQRS